MKECDILGVKTYSDPPRYFQGIETPQPPGSTPLHGRLAAPCLGAPVRGTSRHGAFVAGSRRYLSGPPLNDGSAQQVYRGAIRDRTIIRNSPSTTSRIRIPCLWSKAHNNAHRALIGLQRLGGYSSINPSIG